MAEGTLGTMGERSGRVSDKAETNSVRKRIIEELGVAPTIDAADEVRVRVEFIKDYLRAAHAKALVLGISGGQDSTLAGRLCQLAVEEIRAAGGDAEFIAVRLPYAVQLDEDDAQGAIAFIGPDRTITFNIAGPVDALAGESEVAVRVTLTDFNNSDVRAQTRMSAQ